MFLSNATPMMLLCTVEVRNKPNRSKRRLDGVYCSAGWSFILKRQRLSIARMDRGKGVTSMRALTFSVILFDHEHQRVGLEITL
jgi:hypothetical protein